MTTSVLTAVVVGALYSAQVTTSRARAVACLLLAVVGLVRIMEG